MGPGSRVLRVLRLGRCTRCSTLLNHGAYADANAVRCWIMVGHFRCEAVSHSYQDSPAMSCRRVVLHRMDRHVL